MNANRWVTFKPLFVTLNGQIKSLMNVFLKRVTTKILLFSATVPSAFLDLIFFIVSSYNWCLYIAARSRKHRNFAYAITEILNNISTSFSSFHVVRSILIRCLSKVFECIDQNFLYYVRCSSNPVSGSFFALFASLPYFQFFVVS